MVGVKHNLKVVAQYADHFCFDMLRWRTCSAIVLEKSTVVMMFSKLRERKLYHNSLNNENTQHLLVTYYGPFIEINVSDVYII